MTNYSKASVLFVSSTRSDYYRPDSHFTEVELTTDTRHRIKDLLPIGTTAETVDLTGYSSISHVLIENQDTSNAVILEFSVQIGAIEFASGELAWAVGPPGTITSSADNWVTSGFTAPCFIVVTGAGDSANNATWDVQAVSTTVLTLFEAETVTADPSDTGDPVVTAYKKAALRIEPGQAVLLNSVFPTDGLTLRAETAACNVRLTAAGVTA